MKQQKLIEARRRFTPFPNIRSLISLSPKAKAKVWQMLGITVIQGKGRKKLVHCLGPILLLLNMGIIEQVAQDELQGGDEQVKGQKIIQAGRRRFTPLPNIRSLKSLSPKGKAKV